MTTTPPCQWVVTATAHPRAWYPGHPRLDGYGYCQECLDQAELAITDARATGSVGATRTVTNTDGSEHSATVHRAIMVVTR